MRRIIFRIFQVKVREPAIIALISRGWIRGRLRTAAACRAVFRTRLRRRRGLPCTWECGTLTGNQRQVWNKGGSNHMAQETSGKMRKLKGRVGMPIFVIALLVAVLTLPALGGDEEKDLDTLKNATDVFQEMVNRGDIPANVLASANCIIVLPGVKKVGIG